MKKKDFKPDCLYSASGMMEDFIENGKYPELKQTEKKIKIITSSMKERLKTSEIKRHVFNKQ